jgi:tetratricopeptide (TPR) repeat protein
LDDSLADAKDFFKKRSEADYSSESTSDYQQLTRKLLSMMGTIISSTSGEQALTEMACLGTKATDLSDSGILAARKLMREKPTPDHHALLSYVLYDRANDENMISLFTKKDSGDQIQATASYEKFQSEARHEATELTRTAKGKNLMIADFVLGNIKKDNSEYSDAIILHSQVASTNPQVCGVDLAAQAISNLIYENASAKRPDDAERWFRRYASLYEPSAYDWDKEGDRRIAANDYPIGASAYEKAANISNYYNYDYCYAASNLSLATSPNLDEILEDGRKCVDASVKNTDKNNDNLFSTMLPLVYRDMADILEQRGVYQSALEYAKESLSAKPDDPFVLDIEAKVFSDLERNSECIAAAQAAVRASDGKYPWMNFRLGYCYFATEDWSRAEAAFRIAADGDKSDAVSAFNVALSLTRQGFAADANQWYREALRRKPDEELRLKILNILK